MNKRTKERKKERRKECRNNIVKRPRIRGRRKLKEEK